MYKIVIENFIKPLKKENRTSARALFNGKEIAIDLEKLEISLEFQVLNLERIEGTYGGYRYFFKCPECYKRVRVLYSSYLGDSYACGHCKGAYKSTLNRSKTDCQYYWELALKEARKVDPTYTPRLGRYVFEHFPERPKWMRYKRYIKHYIKFNNYVSKGDRYWL